MIDEAAAQAEAGEIDPAVFFFLTHKSELFHGDAAGSGKLCPSFPGGRIRLPGKAFGAGLNNGQMRDIRPLLLGDEGTDGELIVQCAHVIGAALNANENGGRDREESFDVAEMNIERLGAAADFFERADGRGLAAR